MPLIGKEWFFFSRCGAAYGARVLFGENRRGMLWRDSGISRGGSVKNRLGRVL